MDRISPLPMHLSRGGVGWVGRNVVGTSRAEPDMIRFLVRGCLRNAARVARACKKCDIHSREGPMSTNSHSRKNHRRWKWKVGNGKVLIMNDAGKLVLRKPDDRAPADTSTLPKATDGNVGTSTINYVAHGKSAQRAIQKTVPQQTRGSKHEGLPGGDGLVGGGSLAGGKHKPSSERQVLQRQVVVHCHLPPHLH